MIMKGNRSTNQGSKSSSPAEQVLRDELAKRQQEIVDVRSALRQIAAIVHSVIPKLPEGHEYDFLTLPDYVESLARMAMQPQEASAIGLPEKEFPGTRPRIEPGKTETPTEIDLDVLHKAYGFTLTVDGEVHGLVAGDQGYDPTGIRISPDVWEEIVAWWKGIGRREGVEMFEKLLNDHAESVDYPEEIMLNLVIEQAHKALTDDGEAVLKKVREEGIAIGHAEALEVVDDILFGHFSETRQCGAAIKEIKAALKRKRKSRS
jgi:hypothetical protein